MNISTDDFIQYDAKLKPCPFCGNAEQEVTAAKVREKWIWWVRCPACKVETGHFDDEQTALKMWDRRFCEDDIEEDGYVTWCHYRDRYVREFSASLEGKYERTD